MSDRPPHSADDLLSTDDPRIRHLLESVVGELRRFAEHQVAQINDLVDIGVAMSAQQDTTAVLEMILSHARKVTHADGGTLYLVSSDRKELEFHVVHNDTLKMHQGGTSGETVDIPPVQLFVDDEPNHRNVSAHVVHSREMENIPDVYRAKGFDFTGTRRFDKALKYRSVSMLTVPMNDHTGLTIGVLQLINATDPKTGAVIAFDAHHERLVQSLASLAAVMLTQQNLIAEMKRLFDSFIQALATSIDAMSRHTGNHIARVTELTMIIADRVQQAADGPLAGVRFSPEEMEELRIAAWLHDTGKITTPVHIVNKSTRLEKITDRIEIIDTRFEAKKQQLRAAMFEAVFTRDGGADKDRLEELELALEGEFAKLDDDLHFLHIMNNGDLFMEGDKLERLHRIAAITWVEKGEEKPILTAAEVEDLSIRRGTLNDEERAAISDHVVQSERILNEIAWPRTMPNVPKIASDHHEKLNGKGYPKGLTKDEIFLQSRIMAVADVFEALSAKDRPYKAPMPLSKAIGILRAMAKDGDLDPDVVELFLRSGAVFDYARRQLAPDQVDIDENDI